MRFIETNPRQADADGVVWVIALSWLGLAARRVLRGIRRQASMMAALALGGLFLGAVYHLMGQTEPRAAYGSGFIFGLAMGVLMALARELGRNTVGLSNVLGRGRYPVLGYAPELSAQAMRELPPHERNPLGCLLRQPASDFATAFRDLQAAIGDQQMLAVIGAGPAEGATTAALALAVAATQQGRRVILVDCDVQRRALTQLIEHDVELGVLDVAEQPERWREVLVQEVESGLDVLPAGRIRNPWRTLFDAPGLAILLNQLRAEYDLVVLDCPPAMSADGSMIARRADRCVIVATWDETPVGALNDAVRALGWLSPDAAALFLNRVPQRFRFRPALAAHRS